MIKIGFTGTRHDLPKIQHDRLSLMLTALVIDAEQASKDTVEFHHGDCVGADVAAAEIMHGLQTKIVSHPPKRETLRAHFRASAEVREPKEFHARNHDIVDETDRLVACPEGPETMRSGTWSTIRYAREVGKPVCIIWPDGTIEYLRNP